LRAQTAPGNYFQRRVPGRPLAAAFLADGRHAHVLGYSEQWPDAAEHAPFRYGGCAGPVTPSPLLQARIAQACTALSAAVGLVGLNSLDLLVERNDFYVLEVNPRPGATLDLFDGRAERSLWRLHLDAVGGRLPQQRDLAFRGVRAAAVLYAPRDIAIPRRMAWPTWSADRGAGGSHVRRGAPICTLRAAAPTVPAARAALDRRAAQILMRLGDDLMRLP
jgi:predicted ATP-grasp superfamily ATP-dependent carboligase